MRVYVQPHGRLLHLIEGIKALGRDALVELGQAADACVLWGYRMALDTQAAGNVKGQLVVADKGLMRRPSVMLGLESWGAKARWHEPFPRKPELEPWRYSDNKTALIVGQEPRDFSTLQVVKNYHLWLRDTKRALEAQGWTVLYREHPRMLIEAPRNVPRPGPLGDDFDKVSLVVGLTSSALVEALRIGLPVVAVGEHCFAHELGTSLEKPSLEEPEGREEFFKRLSGLSWTYAELASGQAWEVVREELMAPPADQEKPAKRSRTRA